MLVEINDKLVERLIQTCTNKSIGYINERLIELLSTEEVMRRLDEGGIDNWEWFERSLGPEDEPSISDFEDELYGLLEEK